MKVNKGLNWTVSTSNTPYISDQEEARLKRHSYQTGYEQGDKYRIWKPPVDRTTPLPYMNFRYLPRYSYRVEYLEGFKAAYYKDL